MPNRKKKILMVLYYYHPYVSGVSVYAKRIAEGLAKDGYQVTILTTQFEKNLKKKEIINGVIVIRCPIIFRLGKGVVSPIFMLRMISLSRRFDVINFHLPLAESGIASIFIPLQKIFTTYQCDINLGKGSLVKLIEKMSFLLMKITLWKSKKIMVLSLDYFNHSKMKRYVEKAVEIFPPVDTQNFCRINNTRELKKKLKIEPDNFLIGFVGRIVYEKGIDFLLDSTKYLIGKIPHFKILIVGDFKKVAGGSIKNQLEIYEKKYPGKIAFTGFLSDNELKEFYSLVNVLVLPSIDPLEAFGIVQLEAMCCGCPVIASNLPGVNTAIQKTNFGFLVKPKDSKDIADKIFMVYQNKHSSARFFKEDWDEKNTIAKYEAVIR